MRTSLQSVRNQLKTSSRAMIFTSLVVQIIMLYLSHELGNHVECFKAMDYKLSGEARRKTSESSD